MQKTINIQQNDCFQNVHYSEATNTITFTTAIFLTVSLSLSTFSFHQHSTIIDFYPSDFKVDLNGKKYMWQGVALLPFVDESRLLRALKEYYHTLTPEEGE